MIDEGEVRASDQLAQLTAKAHSVTNAAVSPELHALGRRRLMAAALDLPIVRSGWFADFASFARVHGVGVLGKTLMLTSLTAAVAIAFYLSNVSLPFGTQTPHALTYEIHGGQRVAANYVDALRDSPASVDFSDGTNIGVSAGSRLRIDATQERGARVFVESGSATAHVTHREHSTWVFIAGPFDVRITGTRFTLAWDPHDQAIDLTLHEGSVEVESPLGSSHCVVRAGQRFRASLTTGTMQLENSDELHDVNTPAVSTSVSSDAHAKNKVWSKRSVSGAWGMRASADHERERDQQANAPTANEHVTSERATGARASRNVANNQSTANRATGSRAAPEPAANESDKRSETPDPELHAKPTIADAAPATDWANLVRHGAFQVVVDAATARGIDVSLRDCTASEVRALADAARYTNHTELTERSLNTLRERFSGSRQSAAAAFLLGRTLESRADLRDADHSYTTYLSEAPDGEFASEALAGHMRAVTALQGPAAAKPVALEYLRRYRSGVHADSARRLANGN